MILRRVGAVVPKYLALFSKPIPIVQKANILARPFDCIAIVWWGFFNMGLSQPLFEFIFPYSWYIVTLQLIIFTMVNDDRKQERRWKSMQRSIIR